MNGQWGVRRSGSVRCGLACGRPEASKVQVRGNKSAAEMCGTNKNEMQCMAVFVNEMQRTDATGSGGRRQLQALL